MLVHLLLLGRVSAGFEIRDPLRYVGLGWRERDLNELTEYLESLSRGWRKHKVTEPFTYCNYRKTGAEDVCKEINPDSFCIPWHATGVCIEFATGDDRVEEDFEDESFGEDFEAPILGAAAAPTPQPALQNWPAPKTKRSFFSTGMFEPTPQPATAESSSGEEQAVDELQAEDEDDISDSSDSSDERPWWQFWSWGRRRAEDGEEDRRRVSTRAFISPGMFEPTPQPAINHRFCTQEAKGCPDGSTVSRDPALNCEFRPCPISEPRFCSQDVRYCADASTVSRDPDLNCDFRPCPSRRCGPFEWCPPGMEPFRWGRRRAEGADDRRRINTRAFISPGMFEPNPQPATHHRFCTQEARYCADGSTVSRDFALNCEFRPCPIFEPRFCTQEVRYCSDGSTVSRDPNMNCNFRPCPDVWWGRRRAVDDSEFLAAEAPLLGMESEERSTN